MRNSSFALIIGFMILTAPISAQEVTTSVDSTEVGGPVFVPMVKVGKVLEGGDSIQYMEMSNIYVYPTLTFNTPMQKKQYNRLVRNVKKVLPIAKEVRRIIIETTEVLEMMPDKKAKMAHMKRVEEDIKKTYTPRMKKLTYTQGKLLIKLVNRECNSSAYGAIKAFLGPVRAGMWQAFAWIYGASLMKKYDPEGEDRMTERVILMVEAGQL